MRSIIQDLIGIVLLIGALFIALKSTLKKGADLYRYVIKISKEIKTAPKRQQNVSAAPKKRRTFTNLLGPGWLVLLALIFLQIGLLAWRVSDPSPLTKIEVMRISMYSATLAVLFSLFGLNYFADRIINVVDQILDVIRHIMMIVDVVTAHTMGEK